MSIPLDFNITKIAQSKRPKILMTKASIKSFIYCFLYLSPYIDNIKDKTQQGKNTIVPKRLNTIEITAEEKSFLFSFLLLSSESYI